ncbi:TVP38/TMEM64 family protein [Bacillaceae bacterium W0354]
MGPELSNLDELKEMISDTVIGDFIIRLLEFYGSFGPLPGFFLPFMEAFLPFLPMMVFILANSIVFGLFFGFLLTWSAACTGMLIVFIIIRRLQKFQWVQRLKNQKQVSRIVSFFDQRGFAPLFLLFCFPFTPSALINVVAAFTRMSIYKFMLAVLLGKAVFIFYVSYVGDSLVSFAKNPFRTIIVVLFIAILWFVGKQLEKRIDQKVEEHHQEIAENNE